jgi:hypothetical protein
MRKNTSRERRNNATTKSWFRPGAARSLLELKMKNAELRDTAIELALEIQNLRDCR